MITENLSTLKIHKLTQAQYDRELEAGNIDEHALYLTPDEEVVFPVDSVNGKTGAVQLAASDVEALPISGGTLTGDLIVDKGNSSGFASLSEDGEGGTLRIGSKNGTYTYEMDAAGDNYIRIHTAEKHPSDVGIKYMYWYGDTGTLQADYVKPNNPIAISNGGTGATDVATARANLGVLPISGGTLTGNLNVNDGVSITKDTEGGNITVYPPSTNTYTDYWQLDSHNGSTLRWYASKKPTNPNGSGNVFPLTLYTDGSIAVGNNAKTRSNLGVAPAAESTTYPGCYYRTVDGVTEWINPPMVLDTEYRTTERWLNKVVYTKLVNFGTLPNSTIKSAVVTEATRLIYAIGFDVTSGQIIPNQAYDNYADFGVTLNFNDNNNIVIISTKDASSYTAYILVKYYKE